MDMENGADKTKMDHQQLQRQEEAPPRRKKGGLITMPFIIANEALERVASHGLSANMILYVMGDYHIGVAQATNILFLWSAATNFLPLVGAFISDSYLGRYLTIGLGCIASLLMDKASIIKDAIDYIQELHEQERRIQADLIQHEPGKLKKNAVFDLDQEIPTLSRLKKKRIDRSYDSRRSTTSSIEDLEC
ncbi:hypothetical protein ACSBR2_042883 [Camellia fascicularis]